MNEITNQVAQDFLAKLNALAAMDDTEKCIKDNKIYFKHNDVQYRIRRPVYKEKKEIAAIKLDTYQKCLQNKDLFEPDLIKVLKDAGKDIAKYESDRLALETQKHKLYIDLAQTTDESTIKILEDEIYNVCAQQVQLSMEKNNLLAPSIEHKILEAEVDVCIYLLLEKEDGDKFVKVFASYKDFQNCEDTELIDKAAYFIDEVGVIGRG